LCEGVLLLLLLARKTAQGCARQRCVVLVWRARVARCNHAPARSHACAPAGKRAARAQRRHMRAPCLSCHAACCTQLCKLRTQP
jgi:hypothetical protein